MPSYLEQLQEARHELDKRGQEIADLKAKRAELVQKTRQLDEQVQYLRGERFRVGHEIFLLDQELRSAKHAASELSRSFAVTPDEQEAMILDHLRERNIVDTSSAVDIFRLLLPLSQAAGRQVEPFEVKSLVSRLVRQGKILVVGRTRSARYWLNPNF